MVRDRESVLVRRSETSKSLKGMLPKKNETMRSGPHCRRAQTLGNRRNAGLNFGKFDFRNGPPAGLAVDRHPVIASEQHLQTFVDVADADALLKQLRQLVFRNADAVVLYREMQFPFRQPAPYSNDTAVHLAAQSVPDAVFNNRL